MKVAVILMVFAAAMTAVPFTCMATNKEEREQDINEAIFFVVSSEEKGRHEYLRHNDEKRGARRVKKAKSDTTPVVTGSTTRKNSSSKESKGGKVKTSKSAKKGGPRSSQAKQFVKLTALDGLQHFEQSTPIVVNNEGKEYEVLANVTLRETGIVSLAEAQDMIEEVLCQDNANFIIQYTSEILEDDLEHMFPPEAVLAVDAEVFGECLSDPILIDMEDHREKGTNPDLYKMAVGKTDGYLLIESASLISPQQVRVRGAQANFFDMFENSHMDLRRLKDSDHMPQRELVNVELDGNQLKISHGFDPFKNDKEYEDICEIDVGATITSNTAFDNVSMFFGWTGFDLEIGMAFEYSLKIEARILLKQDLAKPLKSQPWPIVTTMLGPPPLALLGLLKKIQNLLPKKLQKLPDLKLGFYFETTTYLSLEKVEAQTQLGPKGVVEINSGQKEYNMVAWFDPFKKRRSTTFDVKGGYTKNAKPIEPKKTFDAWLEAPTGMGEVEVELLWAFEPQISLWAGHFLFGSVGLTMGPQFTLKSIFGDEAYYDPVTTAAKVIGPCDTCHSMEGILHFAYKEPFFSYNLKIPKTTILGISFEVDKSDRKQSSTVFTKKLGTMCFWRPLGDATLACEVATGTVLNFQCCDGNQFECNGSGCSGPPIAKGIMKHEDPNSVPDFDPCIFDPLCEYSKCQELGRNGHCLSSIDMGKFFCDMPLPSAQCTGGQWCCLDEKVPCQYGEQFSGHCMESSKCQGQVVQEVCTGASANIECCLDSPEPECVVDGLYPGRCDKVTACNDKSGMTPLPSEECTGGKSCCVDTPTCASALAFGECVHETVCDSRGWQKVRKNDSDLCPGKPSVACCIDLPKCPISTTTTTVVGQCMDRDNCKAPGKYSYTLFCPGDSEIQCCADLPSCKIGDIEGNCMPPGDCTDGNLPALSWHDCPGREIDGISCCIPPPLICDATTEMGVERGACGKTGGCEFREATTPNCPLGLSCCLDDCNIEDYDTDCCTQSDCNDAASVCDHKKCVRPSCTIAGVSGECRSVDDAEPCNGVFAQSWWDEPPGPCPGHNLETNKIACCLPELICYATTNDGVEVTGQCQERNKCNGIIAEDRDDKDFCPNNLECCIEDVDTLPLADPDTCPGPNGEIGTCNTESRCNSPLKWLGMPDVCVVLGGCCYSPGESPTGSFRSSAIDLFLLIDVSTSFSSDLSILKGEIDDLVLVWSELYDDLQVGVGTFSDYPISPFGASVDHAYKCQLDLTADLEAIKTTIRGLPVLDGSDIRESQLAAIYQAVTGAGQVIGNDTIIEPGQNANFRPDANKWILLWTDAEFHHPGENSAYPGPTWDLVIDTLTTFGASGRRLQSSSGVKVLGAGRTGALLADLVTIVKETGSIAGPDGIDCNNDGVVSETEPQEGDAIVCLGVSGLSLATALAKVIDGAAATITPAFAAECKASTSIMVRKDGACTATVRFDNIDNGSYGGDSITIEPTELIGLGDFSVVLTVLQSEENGRGLASCETLVTVIDELLSLEDVDCGINDWILDPCGNEAMAPVHYMATVAKESGCPTSIESVSIAECKQCGEDGSVFEEPACRPAINTGTSMITISDPSALAGSTFLSWTVSARSTMDPADAIEKYCGVCVEGCSSSKKTSKDSKNRRNLKKKKTKKTKSCPKTRPSKLEEDPESPTINEWPQYSLSSLDACVIEI